MFCKSCHELPIYSYKYEYEYRQLKSQLIKPTRTEQSATWAQSDQSDRAAVTKVCASGIKKLERHWSECTKFGTRTRMYTQLTASVFMCGLSPIHRRGHTTWMRTPDTRAGRWDTQLRLWTSAPPPLPHYSFTFINYASANVSTNRFSSIVTLVVSLLLCI